MNTSGVISWVLRIRKNDAVTLFSPALAAPGAPVLKLWSVLYPPLPAYRVVLLVLKYVRGNAPVRTSLLAYMMAARAICRRLLAHLARLACSRARFRLGSRIEISS